MRFGYRNWRPRLGMYDRVMVGHYLWHIQITFLALTGVVTAINISSEVGQVWQEFSAGGDLAGIARVAEYIFYRILDNGSQVFPVAFVLAIVWAEVEHALAGRKTMVRSTGMRFRRGVAPLVLVAALSATTQFLLDNVVRPYAFMSLSTRGLGEYGWAYSRARAPRAVWLAIGGDIAQLQLRDDPTPRMSDITVYQFSPDGAVIRLTDAPDVVPRPGEPGAWRFHDARVWDFTAGQEPESGAVVPDISVGFVGHPTLDLDLPISPLWLEYRGIAAKYIPLADLVALASDSRVPDNAPRYSVWLQVRIAQAFNPGLIALCLAGIFFVLLDRFGLLVAGAVILVGGYAGFMVTRVTAVVADHAVVSGTVASWFQTGFFLACAVLVLAFIERRDRRYERSGPGEGGFGRRNDREERA